MVSDFKTKKYLYVFETFFDIDKNGTIDRNDFLVAMSSIAEKRGFTPGDSTFKFMEEMLDLIWNGLSTAAGVESDGAITKDQWIKLWDDYAQNPGDVAEWFQLYAKCIFQLVDAGNDGSIDDEEFAAFFDNFGISKEASLGAFEKLTGGTNTVTWEQFEGLFREFFVSDDEDAPGCYVFGQIN